MPMHRRRVLSPRRVRRGRVPDADRRVAAAGGKELAIRAEAQAVDAAPMSAERHDLFSGVGIPEHDLTIEEAARSEVMAVRAELQEVDTSGGRMDAENRAAGFRVKGE